MALAVMAGASFFIGVKIIFLRTAILLLHSHLYTLSTKKCG